MQSRYDNITAAKTWDGAKIPPNQELLIPVTNGFYSRWRFLVGSAATDTTEQVIFAPTTNGAVGKWSRIDPAFALKLPVLFSTANNAVLFTVPTGFIIKVNNPFIEVTTSFTGGASSAIGVDSSNAGFNTPGDIIGGDNGGGTAGLVAADLTVGYRGRIGPKALSENTGRIAGTGPGDPIILVAGDTIRWNQITSTFTAGAGFVHVPVQLIQ